MQNTKIFIPCAFLKEFLEDVTPTGKKTKIWHIGIQGGKDPRKETGKGNTRNVSSAPDLSVSPETDIEGCQYQDSYCCYASRLPKLVWSRFFFALN